MTDKLLKINSLELLNQLNNDVESLIKMIKTNRVNIEINNKNKILERINEDCDQIIDNRKKNCKKQKDNLLDLKKKVYIIHMNSIKLISDSQKIPPEFYDRIEELEKGDMVDERLKGTFDDMIIIHELISDIYHKINNMIMLKKIK